MRKFKAKESVYYIALLMVIGIFLVWSGEDLKNNWTIRASEIDLVKVKAAMAPVQELNQKYDAVESELEAYKAKYPDPKREEIEKYMRTIFGRDANMAIAISHHECNPANKTYPKCHLKSSVENSIGVFQINLHNQSQWIHAGRIPGNTMEEKIIWLENPFNNTLYAYWVFKTSGWTPWSAFKNGSYLADLKN